MLRDDHGIDHEAVERYKQAGHEAAARGLAAAMDHVKAAHDTPTVGETDDADS